MVMAAMSFLNNGAQAEGGRLRGENSRRARCLRRTYRSTPEKGATATGLDSCNRGRTTMDVLRRAFVIGTTLAILTPALAAIVPPADPVVGTWKLNLAKSTYDPGPPAKSETRVYTGNADTNTVSWTGTNAAGKPVSGHITFKSDGKDYPTAGSDEYDSISVKRIDASTIETVLKKRGKPVGTTRRVVSADGKVMTLTSKVTTAKGTVDSMTRVYDRQ
jgi:hypothetical protein